MGHKFFFNSECLPACNNIHIFAGLFSDIINEYKSLVDKNLDIQKAIITEKMPSDISIGGFSLKEAIDFLEDKNLRRIVFSYFKNYPIDDYLSFKKEKELLEEDYFINIGGTEYKALYLSFISQNNGFLFTVALHGDLKQNTLSLVPEKGAENMCVNNLYGENANTIFIEKCIEALNHEKFSSYEKLKNILGDPVFSPEFEREFHKLPIPQQTSIIHEFDKAKNRENAITPFSPDGNIIKDVSSEKNKCKVYELRIFGETALRVYFHESNTKIFVSNIGKKSTQHQSADIKKAHDKLNKLILTN